MRRGHGGRPRRPDAERGRGREQDSARVPNAQPSVGGGLEISTTRRSGRSSLLRNSSQFDIDIN